MPRPAVSVILSSKSSDDAASVLPALQSQTFPDFEILIAEPQDSSAAGRNRTAEKAQGDYLAFVESGQLWMPEKLEKQMLRLREQPELDWCYCDALFRHTQAKFSDADGLHSGNILRRLLLKNFIPPGSVLLRRGVFEVLGGFDESGTYVSNEEWELWIRVAADHAVALVNEPLVLLPHPATATEPADGQRQLSMKRVVESAVARHQDRLKDLRSESLAEICISAGNAHLKANQRDEARLHFAEALTHSPLRPDAYLSWVSSFLSSEAQQQIRDLHNLGRQLTEKTRVPDKIGVGSP